MPLIRPGMKRPPSGFELIHEKLDAYDTEMRIVMSDDPLQAQFSSGGRRRKKETKDSDDDANREDAARSEKPLPPLWHVARINRERTRYVFNACYRDKIISVDVLNYCCEMNFVDAGLLRRWRLPGYEGLCCTNCCVPGRASAAARMVSKHTNRYKTERRGRAGDDEGSKGTCICRVPVEIRNVKKLDGCMVCGCTGCVSGLKRGRELTVETSEVEPVESVSRHEE